jgi:anti-sigma regulatory factor (Ser/Thr protein kinase)
VPFLGAGLAAGERVVLACRDRVNAVLVEALGADPRVTFVERSGTYLRTPVAVATYRRLVEGHVLAGASRVRLVGEVDFGDDPAGWAEWMRYESIVNVALAPLPLSSVCAYDTRILPEPILRAGLATHPSLLGGGGREHNHGYVEPAAFLRPWAAVDPDPLQATTPAFASGALAHPAELPALRATLLAVLVRAGMPPAARADLVTAVNEVATNGFVHGRPPVTVRLWAAPTRLVVAVTDQGVGVGDPLLAGYAPIRANDPPQGGMGLWLVRQVCGDVQMGGTPEGFTVRLTTAIPGSGDGFGPASTVAPA